ncbi:hypothetical protein D9619_002044 [Psilocybe cf. subviscida]|uniref:Heat shock 70 kDa protein 12A n=1 Tax=Psilocybe cf. subviscida TaxID=2480587 RepID=A0A8H5BEA8_9AGAR|nr:hypothetical protein D9619_002044 [Psilocybe cf. subviscida]
MPELSPYEGTTRKLVLAFDVGTTFSGISYCILDPGQIPEPKGVTKFPSQDHVNGSCKIPSVIYYGEDGKVRAIGAETLAEGVYERAEEEGWTKTEWFKMHLRPRAIRDKDNPLNSLPPLPVDKTAIQVLGDYLKYLLACSKSYIEETQPDGEDFWKSVKQKIQFVLSHPNGWEGLQQSQMRKAAVLGGLIPNSHAGQRRISFVTEGEASLHFAIHHGLPKGVSEGEDGVIIVDAGGGTIDITAYVRKPHTTKPVYEEIAPEKCYLHGSICVSENLHTFLKGFLARSDFLADIDHIVQCFDKGTKLRFRSGDEAQFIKFGGTRDNDANCNIRFGQLKLQGTDVATFFDPSIKCTVEAIKEIQDTSSTPVKHVVLVGGFAASDWLHQSIRKAVSPHGLTVLRPDYHVNKAVSDGAISFFLCRNVQARVSKMTLGVRAITLYEEDKPSHAKRSTEKLENKNGEMTLDYFFDPILQKVGEKITQTREVRQSYCRSYDTKDELAQPITIKLHGYQGPSTDHSDLWMDGNNVGDEFPLVGSIEVDLSHLKNTPTLQTKEGPKGTYYQIACSVVLLLGDVELKVQAAWEEDGEEKRSDAQILYIG